MKFFKGKRIGEDRGACAEMNIEHDILDYVEVPRPQSRSGPHWRIARRLRRPESASAKPGVVWLGGFKSDMLGAKARFLDGWARSDGRSCLRFDYSGHGESDGDFEDGAIGDWLEQSAALFELSTDGSQIVVGSSMGAWIALLLARRLAEKSEAHRLKALILIAPAVDFTEELIWKRLSAESQREILERGVWPMPSAYAGEATPITRRLIEEARDHLLLGGVVRAHAPVHILQGLRDPDVPWRHAATLMECLAADPATVSFIKDGDHRLSRDQDLQRLVAAIESLS
jgi:pimeloyl-ACP methyl ester carboxylesterase